MNWSHFVVLLKSDLDVHKPTLEKAEKTKVSLSNKSSSLVASLVVTKFMTITALNLVTLFVLLKSDFHVYQTHFSSTKVRAY